jgi:predicted nucleic acid-binding protein
MAEGAACLLDSNILLRISKNDDPQQPIIANALKAQIEQGVHLCYTSQSSILECLDAPRRQERLRLTVAETDRLARVIERDFELLPDSRETPERWRALLVQHSIHGVQVHDARLAASMYVHAVNQLLTINVRDFQRFIGLRVTHPSQVTKAT